jgi:hypothetical protein
MLVLWPEVNYKAYFTQILLHSSGAFFGWAECMKSQEETSHPPPHPLHYLFRYHPSCFSHFLESGDLLFLFPYMLTSSHHRS